MARHRRAIEYDFSDWLKHMDPQKKENEYANFDAVYKFEAMQEGSSEILRKFGFEDVELPKLMHLREVGIKITTTHRAKK